MTIIGPPDRKPDTPTAGMRWCECGLHQHPAMIGRHVLRPAKGCPSCWPADYQAHVQPPNVHTVTWLTDDSQRLPTGAIPHPTATRPGDGRTEAESA